jgi:hypothetical protein
MAQSGTQAPCLPLQAPAWVQARMQARPPARVLALAREQARVLALSLVLLALLQALVLMLALCLLLSPVIEALRLPRRPAVALPRRSQRHLLWRPPRCPAVRVRAMWMSMTTPALAPMTTSGARAPTASPHGRRRRVRRRRFPSCLRAALVAPLRRRTGPPLVGYAARDRGPRTRLTGQMRG